MKISKDTVVAVCISCAIILGFAVVLSKISNFNRKEAVSKSNEAVLEMHADSAEEDTEEYSMPEAIDLAEGVQTYDLGSRDDMTEVAEFVTSQGLQGALSKCVVDPEVGDQDEESPAVLGNYYTYYVLYNQGEVTYIVITDNGPEIFEEGM